jgi:transposase
MARMASGSSVVEQARKAIADASTVEQLRQAQAVLFPLDHGLSLSDTAKMIGLSVGWACRLRNAFIRGEVVGDGSTPARGGRRRENFTPERESQVLRPFLDRARKGGVLVVPELKPILEAELGRTMALSSVYNLLHRHGWRKLAPDKHHPQHNVLAQQDWKKNSPKKSGASAKTGQRVRRSR